MLKWIKNKLLNEPKEEDIQEEITFQEEIIVHRDTKKEMDSEDRYFRFPLIPDETSRKAALQRANHKEDLEEASINKAAKDVEQPKLHYKKEYSSLFLQEEVRKVKQAPIIDKEEVSAKEKQRTTRKQETAYTKKVTPSPVKEQYIPAAKPRPTMRKSFKPTQIPSPIYGFKQRPDTDKEKQDTLLSKQEEVTMPPQKFAEPNPLQHGTEELKQEAVVEIVEEIKAPVAEIVEEVEEAVVTEVVEEIKAPVAEIVEEVEEVVVTEVVEEINEAPVAEIVEEVNEAVVTEVAEEVNEVSVAESVEEVEEAVVAEVVEEITEAPTAEVVEEVNEELVVEIIEEVRETPVAANVQPQEQLRTKKRFVPYNVMMLQQDRRTIRETKRNERQSESSKAPVVMEKEEKESEVLPTLLPVEDNRAAYVHPSLSLLEMPSISQDNDDQWIDEQAQLLQQTLFNFNVGAQVIDVTQGPSVTRFEIQPDPGVKVNKITNLADDIKLSLAAKDIRIEAPIPGKSAVGIEVPNRTSRPVLLSEILKTPEFNQHPSSLAVALGLDIAGNPIVTDIQKMPHGLIAGATGSGKSVCINAILLSILYKATPYEVKVMLIDPKMVELAPYNHIPHLISPVITDAKAATAALKWAVEEMEKRYELFAHAGARDLGRYNQLVEKHGQGEKLPYLVIVIDELADLMMVAPGDVEEAICRIAQKARACGIHMLLATQRPSVDVITGLIKANIPTRIAFTVSSPIDSRTIIDMNGADKLLGRGDMLFLGNGSSKAIRAQGVYVSDDEIEEVVSHVKKQMKPNYLFDPGELVTKQGNYEVDDDLFEDACKHVIEMGGASASSLQRYFRVGYNRAARLIDMMEAKGIISEPRGSKPRDILISLEDLEETIG